MGRCNVAMAVLVMLVVAGLHQQCEANFPVFVTFINNSGEKAVVLDPKDHELVALEYEESVDKLLTDASFITVKLQSGAYAKLPIAPPEQLRMRPSSVEVSSPKTNALPLFILIGSVQQGVTVDGYLGWLVVPYEKPNQQV